MYKLNAESHSGQNESNKSNRPIQGPNMEVVITSKVCSHCRQEKDLSEFRKGSGRGKRKNYCKPCDDMKSHQNYIKNRARRKKQIKEWNKKARKALSEMAKKSLDDPSTIKI